MVTLKDIARDTGFSVSVVSRALNPQPDQQVAPETKRIIQDAMRRLNYRRNHTASLLARGRSAAVGVFLPGKRQALLLELIHGISSAATAHGFQCDYYFGINAEDYLRFCASLNDIGGSGILTYPGQFLWEDPRLVSALEQFRKKGGKVLVLNPTHRPFPGADSWYLDNAEGGRLAARHLLACGCTEFHLFGPGSSFFWQARLEGFFEVLNAAGKTAEVHDVRAAELPDVIGTVGGISPGKPGTVQGVFAFSDTLAMQLMQQLHRAGAGGAIGKSIRIVGYDDTPGDEYVTPPLTSIAQPFREIGQAAMQHLIAMITGETAAAEPSVPPPALRVRLS